MQYGPFLVNQNEVAEELWWFSTQRIEAWVIEPIFIKYVFWGGKYTLCRGIMWFPGFVVPVLQSCNSLLDRMYCVHIIPSHLQQKDRYCIVWNTLSCIFMGPSALNMYHSYCNQSDRPKWSVVLDRKNGKAEAWPVFFSFLCFFLKKKSFWWGGWGEGTLLS